MVQTLAPMLITYNTERMPNGVEVPTIWQVMAKNEFI